MILIHFYNVLLFLHILVANLWVYLKILKIRVGTLIVNLVKKKLLQIVNCITYNTF